MLPLIDTDNLLKVRTYSETSQYFVDGTMGWIYTTDGNEATNLFSGNAKFAHFNRTNITLMGHPNGYDDTTNTVTIIEGGWWRLQAATIQQPTTK